MLLGSLCIPAGTVQRSITSSSLEATPTGLAPVRSVTNFHRQKVQSDILFSPFFSLPPSSVSLRRTHTLNQHVWIFPRKVSLPPSIRARTPSHLFSFSWLLPWLVGWLVGWRLGSIVYRRREGFQRGKGKKINYSCGISRHHLTSPLLFHIPKVWLPDLSIVLREALHHRHTRFFKNKKTVEFPPGSRSLPTDLYSCGGQRASGAPPLACQSKAPVKQPSSRIKLSVRPTRDALREYFASSPELSRQMRYVLGKKIRLPRFCGHESLFHEARGPLKTLLHLSEFTNRIRITTCPLIFSGKLRCVQYVQHVFRGNSHLTFPTQGEWSPHFLFSLPPCCIVQEGEGGPC